MKWFVRIFQGLLTVAFILTGVMKITGNAQQVQLFTDVFGYSLGFMHFVGVCEILGGVGLLIGFWNPRIALLASGGLVLLMAGAAFSHLHAGQGIGVAMPSLILLVLGVVIFIGKRTIKTQG